MMFIDTSLLSIACHCITQKANNNPDYVGKWHSQPTAISTDLRWSGKIPKN